MNFGDKKRFKVNPVYDESLYPPPQSLKRNLQAIQNNFMFTCNRKMDIMDTSEGQKLYGFITTYEADNFCWIQPTRSIKREVKDEYHNYLKTINSYYRHNLLEMVIPGSVRVGLDVVAQYEADNHWYRAIVIDKPIDDRWMVVFVDYGNIQRCRYDQLAHIVQNKDCDHFHAPIQAVCCRLYNLVPKLPQNRDQIDIKLEEFYSKNSHTLLELIVKNSRTDFVVDCDVFVARPSVKGEHRFYRKHIAQSIVDDKLATFADPAAAYSIMLIKPESSKTTRSLSDESEDESLSNAKTFLKKEINVMFETDLSKPDEDVKTIIKIEPGSEMPSVPTKRNLDGTFKVYKDKPIYVNGVPFRPFG